MSLDLNTIQWSQPKAFLLPFARPAANVSSPIVPDRRRRPRATVDRREKPRTVECEQVKFDETIQYLDSGSAWVDSEGNRSVLYRACKRSFDIAGALVILLLASPIMLTILLVLTATTRGKPLFVQDRVGYRGRKFKMFKFRTMRLDADKMQHMVANEKEGPIFKNRRDPRITKLGRILRATSLDETPQLLNVLLGHMALVGPRPMVIPEVARQKQWQLRRLGVKPGLTCLWQVSGRSNIGFEDWMRMDIWYLSNQKLSTDVKLLLKTPLKVISCNGAY